jgi:hypothetical protein
VYEARTRGSVRGAVIRPYSIPTWHSKEFRAAVRIGVKSTGAVSSVRLRAALSLMNSPAA